MGYHRIFCGCTISYHLYTDYTDIPTGVANQLSPIKTRVIPKKCTFRLFCYKLHSEFVCYLLLSNSYLVLISY